MMAQRPEAGLPMSCGIAFPRQCGTDQRCLVEELCGSGLEGEVSVASCTFRCFSY